MNCQDERFLLCFVRTTLELKLSISSLNFYFESFNGCHDVGNSKKQVFDNFELVYYQGKDNGLGIVLKTFNYGREK